MAESAKSKILINHLWSNLRNTDCNWCVCVRSSNQVIRICHFFPNKCKFTCSPSPERNRLWFKKFWSYPLKTKAHDLSDFKKPCFQPKELLLWLTFLLSCLNGKLLPCWFSLILSHTQTQSENYSEQKVWKDNRFSRCVLLNTLLDLFCSFSVLSFILIPPETYKTLAALAE